MDQSLDFGVFWKFSIHSRSFRNSARVMGKVGAVGDFAECASKAAAMRCSSAAMNAMPYHCQWTALEMAAMPAANRSAHAKKAQRMRGTGTQRGRKGEAERKEDNGESLQQRNGNLKMELEALYQQTKLLCKPV